jgi:hypothetical protein
MWGSVDRSVSHASVRWILLFGVILLNVVPAAYVYLAIEPVLSMLIPIGLSLLPLLTVARRWAWIVMLVAGVFLHLFAFAGMFSVGRMFVPGALGMLLLSAYWRALKRTGQAQRNLAADRDVSQVR